MAKCIRVVGQGVPVRMSDEDAHRVVTIDGDGEYCSKGFWREWYVSVEREPFRAKLVNNHITRVEALG
jgi:hypothetical protein